MICDHEMRSGGFCGRPMGHGGKHYRPETVQREIERMRLRRMTPGECTVSWCNDPRTKFGTGSYDDRCHWHKMLHDRRRRSRRMLEQLDRERYDEWSQYREMPPFEVWRQRQEEDRAAFQAKASAVFNRTAKWTTVPA